LIPPRFFHDVRYRAAIKEGVLNGGKRGTSRTEYSCAHTYILQEKLQSGRSDPTRGKTSTSLFQNLSKKRSPIEKQKPPLWRGFITTSLKKILAFWGKKGKPGVAFFQGGSRPGGRTPSFLQCFRNSKGSCVRKISGIKRPRQ